MKVRYLIAISLFFIIGCDNQRKNMIENCATTQYIESGLYFHSNNLWLISNNSEYKNNKATIEKIKSNIQKAKNVFKDKQLETYLRRELKQYSKQFLREESIMLTEKIKKISINDKKKLYKFIDYYSECEKESIQQPNTFELQWAKKDEENSDNYFSRGKR